MLSRRAVSLLVVLSFLLFSFSIPVYGKGSAHKEVVCNYDGALPDSSASCTPGEPSPDVTSENIGDTICVSGYSKGVRPTTKVTTPIKKTVMKAYGNTVAQSYGDLEADCGDRKINKAIIKRGSKCYDLSKCVAHSNNFKCYELDHLISLELGGCPACVTNLWPEPYYPKPGAYEKDQVENYLHKKVCEGEMVLEDAQMIISQDWVGCYKKIKAHEDCQ